MTCSMSECVKAAYCRGFCLMHYERLKRHGDPAIVKRIRYHGALCSVAGCLRAASVNTICNTHNQRVRRGGSVDYVTSTEEWKHRCRAASKRLGQLKLTTYMKFHGVHLHRIVAAEKIGRPLRAGEIVHHIDGDKHNNHPDNLDILIDQSSHARKHLRRGRFSTR